MNTSLLARIVSRPKPQEEPEPEDGEEPLQPVAAEPSLPPFVKVLLKQFGITPEAINAYAEGLRDAILKELTAIHAKLATIENKCNELESNHRILLEWASKDEEHDGFLATLEGLTVPTITRMDLGVLEPCPKCGKTFCSEHSAVEKAN